MNLSMQQTLNNLLTGNIFAGAAVVAFVLTLWASRTAYVAWQDLHRLDAEQQGVRDRLLRPLLDRVRPRDALAIRQLRHELMQAGMRNENALERYTFARAMGLCGAGGITALLIVTGTEAVQVLVCGGLAFYIAFLLPDFYIARKKSARQAKLGRALPPMIDLMVLCLEVGLSVESAFERVALEMRSMEPLMADEAGIMVSEMGAGLTFPQALKRMAERVGLEDLTTLSRLISQASALGASVVKALREYSDSAFEKRVLSLEEKAGKLSSQMVLPITTCMLPSVMIALVGPAGILLVRAFSQV